MSFMPASEIGRLGLLPMTVSSYNPLFCLQGTSTPASVAWPTANLAIYVPLRMPFPIPIARFWAANGAAVSGNLDIGIYRPDGTKVVSTGSTAQAGVNLVQFIDVTDMILTPGDYFLALALSNTSGGFFLVNNALGAWTRLYGIAEQTSALPLPSTATFAASTRGFHPLFGFTPYSSF